jgi:hypothetical protein
MMTTETQVVVSAAPLTGQLARYWRIRTTYEAGDNVTKDAWEEGIVGIWYGAWNPEQFEKTLSLSKSEATEILTKINIEAGLNWPIKGSYLDTARRFWRIAETDWVFTYFDDSIHLGRLASTVERVPHSTLTRNNELFKYRRLASRKTFSLSKLPDCFRLLCSAGRGNVHEVPGTASLIELLAASDSESDVCARFRSLPWEEWLQVLGPHGWEALCLGYLIVETGFVPTGLDIGRTLPLFDLIGKNRSGHRIYAQCKKDPNRMTIEDGFLESCARLGTDSTVYLFAYNGCVNSPPDAKLITGADLRKWFAENENGRNYMKLLRG